MRDIFFYELKAVNKAVVELIQSKNCEKEMNDLMTIINRVRELSMVSIKEGPMAMEEVVINNPLNNITSVKYLEETVSHICDGYSAEQLEDYCWTRYFALNLSGFEALQYLVIMRGGLCIQNRDNSYISETEMLAMIPKEIAECYRQNFFSQKNSSTSEIDLREKYYKGELDIAQDNEFYFLIKTTDYLFRTLDNRSIQRILRDTDNRDLSSAMKGLSGNARHRIFDNLPKRLGTLVAEDMEYKGNINRKEIARALTRIFDLILKLINCKEICFEDIDADGLNFLAKIFSAGKNDESTIVSDDYIG